MSKEIMQLLDDDETDELETCSHFSAETIINNESDSDDENYKLNNPLERHSVKSSYKSLFFGWGSTNDGQLGLGGLEDDYILSPRQITFHDEENIKYVACGEHHSLVLTYNGMVYSCGNNDYGQLGRDKSRTKLQKINGLDNHNIVNATCGEHHSVAVNEWGQLFSWGSNSHGQLGISNNLNGIQPVPKIVKALATKHVIQISCGYKHCLALLNDGTLYSWGSNDCGQLGLGLNFVEEKVVSQPEIVKVLTGVPIAFIACGGYHSFAISKSGVVYGWGKNSFGQLGLNHQNNRPIPSLLNTLRTAKVKHIACGEDFSVFLTEDGGVFTCGAGMYGQLGHGAFNNEILPKKVVELMGSTVTQICCGRKHTLTLIPSRGRVYAFGLGSVGQLGNRISKNSFTPQVALGPWVTSENPDEMHVIRRIYSGGDHCFVTVTKKEDNVLPEDCRLWPENTQIWNININILTRCLNIPVGDSVDQELMTYLEIVMSSLSCFNASFMDVSICAHREHDHGLNLEMAINCFKIISKIEHSSLLDTILTCISTMVVNLPSVPIDIEVIRSYLILPLYHEFLNPKNSDILQLPFGERFLSTYTSTEKWYKALSDEHFELLILIYKNVFVEKLKTLSQAYVRYWEQGLVVPLEVLAKLNILNKSYGDNIYEKHGDLKVPCQTFYIAELSENIEIRVDYVKWVLDEPKNKHYFCNYPFIFDAEAKTILLQTDQSMQMQDAMNNAAQRVLSRMIFTPMGTADISQFLDIHVSRNNIVEDTIRELSEHTTSDLKKPLRVHFLGEEAEDAGGVRKEFFMLVLRDILDPKYGMFQSYEETNSIWFREDTFEDDTMFFLIGILCGLAIYNFTIINIPFPLAMYKKLLNEPVKLQDVKGLSPTLYKSLEDILNYTEPDLEEVFGLNFDITRDVFGEIKVIPLKPNGENILVTLENKQEFVELYVDMILNKLVEARFRQFNAGFHKVCGGRVLQLFHAQELMSVVIGNEDYDWYQLENNAIYKKGYSSSDPTIRMFWESFHELSLEDKKKFLLYLTGSDRIPIQGMKAIKIVIQPTSDDKYLPVAHTCFNLLDLPRYNTKERLKYKLLQAIQQTQGFSLV